MSPHTAPIRGQVYFVDVPSAGPHYWLVVSNNLRNAAFTNVLTVMLTTTAPRAPRPSYVALDKRDKFEGWVACDGITVLHKQELNTPKGALSPETMRAIDAGLAYALGIRFHR